MPFRSERARCPGCDVVMRQLEAASASVDRCDRCGGVWIDWFDGPVGPIAAALDPRAHGQGGGGEGSMACPRCHEALVAEPLDDERLHVAQRCGSCAGLFLPVQAFGAAVAACTADRPEAREQKPALGRLAAALRSLVGG